MSRSGHEISTIPAALGVALPRGARVPASSGALARHSFDRAATCRGEEKYGPAQTRELHMGERALHWTNAGFRWNYADP